MRERSCSLKGVGGKGYQEDFLIKSPLVTRLEAKLRRHPLCAVTAYIGQRVFHRVIDDQDEILCLISFEGTFRGWIWGHVFFREGQWFCVLANFSDDLPALNEREIFEWHHWFVRNRGNFEPLQVQCSGEAFSVHETFGQALSSLKYMIEVFDPVKRVPREGEGSRTEGYCETDIFEAYGFPLCDPELWEPSPAERRS